MAPPRRTCVVLQRRGIGASSPARVLYLARHRLRQSQRYQRGCQEKKQDRSVKRRGDSRSLHGRLADRISTWHSCHSSGRALTVPFLVIDRARPGATTEEASRLFQA